MNKKQKEDISMFLVGIVALVMTKVMLKKLKETDLDVGGVRERSPDPSTSHGRYKL